MVDRNLIEHWAHLVDEELHVFESSDPDFDHRLKALFNQGYRKAEEIILRKRKPSAGDGRWVRNLRIPKLLEKLRGAIQDDIDHWQKAEPERNPSAKRMLELKKEELRGFDQAMKDHEDEIEDVFLYGD